MIQEAKAAIEKAAQSFSDEYFKMKIRYAFICVKAQPEQLLSVQYKIEDSTLKIENMADACLADEYTFHIFPKERWFMALLTKSVLEAHPNFKVKSIDSPYVPDTGSALPKDQILAVGMPDINKDLHDLYVKAADLLFDETKALIEAEYAKAIAEATTHLSLAPVEFLDSLKEELCLHHDLYISQSEKLHDRKIKEIEEAYAYYQENGERPLYSEQAKEVKIEEDELDEEIKQRVMKQYGLDKVGEQPAAASSAASDGKEEMFNPGSMMFN
ncbi:MAG: hypothetical protein HUJ89_06635 [Bacteroidales bacterium]|nr:hypothetical protein [Bacteroidales bacterium]